MQKLSAARSPRRLEMVDGKEIPPVPSVSKKDGEKWKGWWLSYTAGRNLPAATPTTLTRERSDAKPRLRRAYVGVFSVRQKAKDLEQVFGMEASERAS